MSPPLDAAKAAVRDLLGDLLFFTKVTSPKNRLTRHLTIVTFHRVLTESQVRQYPLPGLSLTPEELDLHLGFLTAHFECMTLREGLRRWEGGQQGDRPLLALTFDDGQLDNFENALPVLEKYGVRASFYVPSQVLGDHSPLWHDDVARAVLALRTSSEPEAAQLLGSEGLHAPQTMSGDSPEEWAVNQTKAWKPTRRVSFLERAASLGAKLNLAGRHRPTWDGFMSVEQMKKLLERGHEIGAHSHSHALLPQLDDHQLTREIVGCKQLLEEAIGSEVETFCYPNGDNDPRVQAVVKSAGYRAAVTTAWGSNPPGSDVYALSRCDMHARHSTSLRGKFSPARLAWRISGIHPGLRSLSPQTSREGSRT